MLNFEFCYALKNYPKNCEFNVVCFLHESRQVCDITISELLLNPTYNFTSDRLFVPFFFEIVNLQKYPFIFTVTRIGQVEVDIREFTQAQREP